MRFKKGDIVRRSKKYAEEKNEDFKMEGIVKDLGTTVCGVEFETDTFYVIYDKDLRLVRRPEQFETCSLTTLDLTYDDIPF